MRPLLSCAHLHEWLNNNFRYLYLLSSLEYDLAVRILPLLQLIWHIISCFEKYEYYDIIIWFAYKCFAPLISKLAQGLKRFSIFQNTKLHQKTSVFTKFPRDPQKWRFGPPLKVLTIELFRFLWDTRYIHLTSKITFFKIELPWC